MAIREVIHSGEERRGYFMSEEKKRQIKAMNLLEYVESKQQLVALQDRAQRLAVEFEGLAKLLRENPQNIAIDAYTSLLNHTKLGDIIADIRVAITEVAKREELVGKLGVSI